MLLRQGAQVAVFLLVLCCALAGPGGNKKPTNRWEVKVNSGGRREADRLASKYGFDSLGPIDDDPNIPENEHVYEFALPTGSTSVGAVVNHFWYHVLQQPPGLMTYEDDLPQGYLELAVGWTSALLSEPTVDFAVHQERSNNVVRGYNPEPSDPKWKDQWSLDNPAGNDLNVVRAWLQGLTGCGTTVGIVDGGVEYTHPDLKKNYVSSLHYDYLHEDYYPSPDSALELDNLFLLLKLEYGSIFSHLLPLPSTTTTTNHGTSVAGTIAMERDNGKCGVGVAYNAFITALRVMSEPKSIDTYEAKALSAHKNLIDIYSCSWGPSGGVRGPGPATKIILKRGAEMGRNGKGSIYVFAAGNAGKQRNFFTGYSQPDSCAADGYVNSIYTIAVGSVARSGQQSSMDEECAGKMVVAFNGDPDVYVGDKLVTTTDLHGGCYDRFLGTSAATPLVSGVLALLLEANPNLTWRDVQYLIVYTANRNGLVGGEWTTNKATPALRFSHKFGFGAIDAEAIVTRGRHWINVPEQLARNITPFESSKVIEADTSLTLPFTVESDIVFLEHVVLVFTMSPVQQFPQRGRVTVDLISPSGTISHLLPERLADTLSDTFDNWPLKTVHFWGENPAGTWKTVIKNKNYHGSIEVEVPSVTFYGTSKVPEAVSRIPTQCSPECDSKRGCAASGAEFCDACRELRVASTRKCVSSCPEGLKQSHRYCYNESELAKTCNAVKPTVPLSAQRVHASLRRVKYGAIVLLIVKVILLYKSETFSYWKLLTMLGMMWCIYIISGFIPLLIGVILLLVRYSYGTKGFHSFITLAFAWFFGVIATAAYLHYYNLL